jgi:HK97 family phage major capsid protein
LGFPVELVPSLPQVGTSLVNLPMLYFGDLSLAAILGSRRGVTISTTPNRYLEYDLLGVKATSRWDINVHDLGDNTTAGPLVALVGA